MNSEYLKALERITQPREYMHPDGIEGTFKEMFLLITWINRFIGFLVGLLVGLLLGSWLGFPL
jgi:hypothetical protein